MFVNGNNFILTGELKKVESRVDSLKMREASGADVDFMMKIEKNKLVWSISFISSSLNDNSQLTLGIIIILYR